MGKASGSIAGIPTPPTRYSKSCLAAVADLAPRRRRSPAVFLRNEFFQVQQMRRGISPLRPPCRLAEFDSDEVSDFAIHTISDIAGKELLGRIPPDLRPQRYGCFHLKTCARGGDYPPAGLSPLFVCRNGPSSELPTYPHRACVLLNASLDPYASLSA